MIASIPAPPSPENLLGTDTRGRDMVAQLIYGFRISILFGLALTAAGVVLDIFFGAIQGYFVGKVDLVGQRLIEIWSAIPESYLLIIFFGHSGTRPSFAAGTLKPVWLDGAFRLCAR